MLWRGMADVHNAAAFVPGEYGDGICRFPLAVRSQMERPDASDSWTGTEIRFVITEGKTATVRLYCPDTDTLMNRLCMLYLGDHQYGWTWLHCAQLQPGMNEIPVTLPDNIGDLEQIAAAGDFPFFTQVVRLIMPGGKFELCAIDGAVRPPQREELPARCGVFYGSSITHGSLSQNMASCYVSLCARRLGVDVFNKGVAGSCHMEPALTDWLLDTYPDADFLSVEVGTNCYSVIPDEELQSRVQHLLERFSAAPGIRRLLVIDSFIWGPAADGCRELVRRALSFCSDDRVAFVSGRELLPERRFYSADGVHPTIDGHIRIADGLVPALQQGIT